MAAHRAGKHVRELESSGAFSCSEAKPAYVESSTSHVTFAGDSIFTPSDVRQLPPKGVSEWKNHPGLAVIPSSLLQPGSVHRLGVRTGLLAKRIAVSRR